jgi:hypothetical protein
LHGAHIAIMANGTGCPTGPERLQRQVRSLEQLQLDGHTRASAVGLPTRRRSQSGQRICDPLVDATTGLTTQSRAASHTS